MQVFSEEGKDKVEGLLDVTLHFRNGQVTLCGPTMLHVWKFNDLQTIRQNLLTKTANPRIGNIVIGSVTRLGDFLKGLGHNFSYKIAQIFGDFEGYFFKLHF